MKKEFLKVFEKEKPIFAMLHLKGETSEEIFNRAIKEIKVYYQNGVDAVIVENYYGNYNDMVRVLEYLHSEMPDYNYGINCLNNDAMSFEMAIKYNALFIQLDSVAGHLEAKDDITFEAFMKTYRERYEGYVLGGVRFKYQPYKSGRSVREDLIIGMDRCDAIVVTQDATGQETSMDKIQEFKDVLGRFPLIVGAGITPSNMSKQFNIADGAIVGSYFKDTYKDTGDVDASHVKEIIDARNNYLRGKE